MQITPTTDAPFHRWATRQHAMALRFAGTALHDDLLQLALEGALVELCHAPNQLVDFRHRSYHDLLFQHGQADQISLATVGLGYPTLTEQQCYVNALHLATTTDLTYVEGMARASLLWVHHAWCIDANGTIVDPTWGGRFTDVEQATYLGIPFATEFALARQMGDYSFGILASDWEHGTNILRNGLTFVDGVAIGVAD